MLTFVARLDIVVDPFGEFFLVEVSRDQLNCSFLSQVFGCLRVVTFFDNLR